MKVASPSEIGAKVAVAPPHQHNMPGAAASVRGPRPSSTAASVAEPAENAPCGYHAAAGGAARVNRARFAKLKGGSEQWP